MFNFFDEIKGALQKTELAGYNLVNISGKILYAEGHTGICQLSKESISFKYKGGVIMVEGKDLVLEELQERTLKITGHIKKVEAI